MLAYVYGVVPLSLCRNGGCGVGSGSSKPDQDDIDDDEIWHEMNMRKFLYCRLFIYFFLKYVAYVWQMLRFFSISVIGSHEKSPLLNDVERQDGTSVITRISTNSGLSSAQQIPNRLQVQAELCRRRPSIESGELLITLLLKYYYIDMCSFHSNL